MLVLAMMLLIGNVASAEDAVFIDNDYNAYYKTAEYRIDIDSVRPIQYKYWDFVKAKVTLVLDNKETIKRIVYVDKDTKQYVNEYKESVLSNGKTSIVRAMVVPENFDTYRGEKADGWVDKILEIAKKKEGR